MDVFQRKRFDNLLGQATNPAHDCIAREHIARAFGYIDGLLEGDAIQPMDYSGLFNEVLRAESLVRERQHRRMGIAS